MVKKIASLFKKHKKEKLLGFYNYDIWEDIKNKIGDKIPKGYTLYGEALGYLPNGAMIQKDYDYGCNLGEYKLEIYRITQTTPDGLVTELSWTEIEEFCKKVNLNSSYRFFYGKACDWLDGQHQPSGFFYFEDNNEWRKEFIKKLEEIYNEKDCFMCNNKVPEEGIVVRKENLFEFEAYKLKSFRFLEWETGQLDKGVSDIESEN